MHGAGTQLIVLDRSVNCVIRRALFQASNGCSEFCFIDWISTMRFFISDFHLLLFWFYCLVPEGRHGGAWRASLRQFPACHRPRQALPRGSSVKNGEALRTRWLSCNLRLALNGNNHHFIWPEYLMRCFNDGEVAFVTRLMIISCIISIMQMPPPYTFLALISCLALGPILIRNSLYFINPHPFHFMQRTAKCFQKIVSSIVCLLCNWVTWDISGAGAGPRWK